MTQKNELLEALKDLEAMAERYRPLNAPYPDAQKKARAAIARAEQAERVEPVEKDVNSTHTPAAWQVWVGADTPLNAPMGWQLYNTYDSLRSAEATARTINAAQQAPFAKVISLYATPPYTAVSEALTDEQIQLVSDSCAGEYDYELKFARAIEAAHNIRSK